MVRNIAPYLDPRLRGGDKMGSKLRFYAEIRDKIRISKSETNSKCEIQRLETKRGLEEV